MQNENGEEQESLNPSLQSTIDFIVVSIIKYFLFVCIPLTTLSLARIITRGFIPVMGLHIFLLLVLAFSFFRRKQLSSTFLSIVIVVIFFLLALGGFFTYYITIYLFPATVLSIGFAALLMSKRTAMISLFCEGSILLIASLAFSKTKIGQSIFEVLVYCVFSYFLIFAIDKVKISFLFLIKSLKEKEIAEKKANEDLSKALDSRTRFLALMSHEIRTPLNSILLASENLQATPLSEEQKELAEVIESSNNSIQVLIKDILDFTKGQSGKETIEGAPFNLKKLAQQIVDVTRSTSSSKRVSLNLHYELKQDFFTGAQVKVAQIITNLLSNSMKFTTDGEVNLFVQRNTVNDRIIIKVQDTGVGIEESRLEVIFDEFEQEDNSTTRIFGGTGLGLAIVKQVVSQLQGSLDVKSKKNQGSTFTIEIPLQVTKEIQAQEELTPGGDDESINLSKLRILVFEDNQTNANLMIKRIKKMGVDHVETALNGRDGIEVMKEVTFDLIIMDIQMPILNGIEATKIIRSSTLGENSSKIPIIGLSANSFQEDVEFALEAGMDAYLSKPAKKEELKAALVKFSK